VSAAFPEPEQLAAEAARLVAVALAEPAGTTRGATKTLRFAKGSDLKEWVEQYADEIGLSSNGAILLAIQVLRAAVERTRAEGTTR
jgi:hypothetical protein